MTYEQLICGAYFVISLCPKPHGSLTNHNLIKEDSSFLHKCAATIFWYLLAIKNKESHRKNIRKLLSKGKTDVLTFVVPIGFQVRYTKL